MNTLEQQINNDLKQAMLTKDSNRVGAIRGLKSAISVAKTANTHGIEFTDSEILSVIQKQIKQRRESGEIYKTQNRVDLFIIENVEAKILESYLPQQLSVEEVTATVSKIITSTGASSIKDMGKVMGIVKTELAGKTDNKTISDVVKSLLS